MILSDLGKFFNDTKHRAASLQQLSFFVRSYIALVLNYELTPCTQVNTQQSREADSRNSCNKVEA